MKSNSDKLELFFEKVLSNYSLAKDEWNKAPVDVWEKVEEKLEDENSRNFIPWKVFMSTFLIISLVMSILFFYENKISDLQEKLILSINSISELEKKVSEVDRKLELAIQSNQNEVSNSKRDAILKNQIQNKPLKYNTSNRDRLVLNKGIESIEIKNKDMIYLNSKPITKPNYINNEDHKLEPKRLNFQLTKAPSIEKLNMSFEGKNDFHLIPFYPKELHDPSQKTNKWSLGINGGIHQVERLSTRNAKSTAFSPKAFQLGMHVKYHARKNWSLETGVDYLSYQINNVHESSFSYLSNEESINTRGTIEYKKFVNLNSGIGLYKTFLIFDRLLGSMIEESKEINLRINSRTTVSYLQVPLIFNYKLKSKYFDFIISSGVLSRFSLNENFQLRSAATDHYGFQFNRGELENRSDIEKIHLGYLLGLGIEFPLNSGLSLGVGWQYLRNISRQVITTNNNEIYLRNHYFNSSINYYF